MRTLKVAFVHMLNVLVLCHQNGAAFCRSLLINEATTTGEIKQTFHDRKDQDYKAVGWLENRGKVDSDSRKKRAVTGDSGYGSRLDAGNNIANGNLQKHLFADLGKRAAVIDSGYRSRLDTAQTIALGNLQRVLFADLGKRAAVGDSGYGSRLDAGQNIAAGNLQRVLFADLGKRAAVGDSGYGSRLDAGQNIAAGNLQRVLFADLGKRAMTGDSGYGSRLDAGYSIASDYLQRSLFDSLGKRAVDFTDTYMPAEQRFLPEFVDLGKSAAVIDYGYGSRLDAGQNTALGNYQRVLFSDLGKRALTGDSGYGSRLDAGHNIANDYLQRSLFDSLGKRAVDFTDGYLPSEQRFLPEYGYGSSLTERIVKRVAGYDEIFEPNSQTYGIGMETDSGYGSRVSAGNQLSYDFATMGDIFGQH